MQNSGSKMHMLLLSLAAAGFFFAGIYAILIKSNQWAGGTSVEDYRTIRGTATGEYEEKKSEEVLEQNAADEKAMCVRKKYGDTWLFYIQDLYDSSSI